MHIISLFIDLDNEHLGLSIVIEDFAHLLHSFFILILHDHIPADRLQVFRPPPIDLLLDYLAFALIVVKNVQW